MIAEYGDHLDMSNPKTLRDFIVDAVKKFPADNVARILNDHGGGFTGAMSDDSDGHFMSTPALAGAIAEAQKITGKKIAIIGFDACLEGEAEVAYENRANADYFLGSEESEGGTGWTYDSMLSGKPLTEAISRVQLSLSEKINVGPKEFCKIVVDVCREHQEDISTFSALDLSQLDGAVSKIDGLSAAIKQTKDKDAVRKAVRNAEHFGGGYLPYRDIHDLQDLAEQLQQQSPDAKVKAAAAAVIAQLPKAVIANENSPSEHPHSHGLSIYMPIPSSDTVGYNYRSLAFAKNTKWVEAILALKSAAGSTGDDPASAPAVWPDGHPKR